MKKYLLVASSEEGLEMCGLNISTNNKAQSSRNNTALHVCWHRGVTVSFHDQIKSDQVHFFIFNLRQTRRIAKFLLTNNIVI